MAVTTNADESIRAALAAFIKSPTKDDALEQTLRSITGSAVELIDGVDFADILLVDAGRARSVAPTRPGAVELDQVQLSFGQGPCLEAATTGSTIRSEDMTQEQRWPDFAAAAMRVGVFGMISFQLLPHGKTSGALNLFSHRPLSLDPRGETTGALLATLATVALVTAASNQQFEAALVSRDVIGQAKGMLMHHYKVDAGRAFDMLKVLSQNENTPLRLIAERVIDTF
ncbi:MAG: hypothetical protein K0R01_3421 [Mycobacterium sp.]|jgi:hypothetical protein|nr:hypothetical protein [Mycobacterium sp.]